MAGAETIAFIGLGAMGSAMAGELVKAGFAVRGHDISAEARAAFAAAGGSPAASPREAVRAQGRGANDWSDRLNLVGAPWRRPSVG